MISNPKLLVLLSLLSFGWYLALFVISPDKHQGEVYRIIYLHVPLAFSAFYSTFLLFIFSLLTILRKKNCFLLGQRSAAEIALFLTCLTLITGSLWAKPTWNVWWTWDARLATTLLLAILLACYLLLYNGLNYHSQRLLPCSIFGLIIAIDVPIIYQSVNWWRTLHQPQTILRPGGSTIDPQMLYLLLFNIFIWLLLASFLIHERKRNLKLIDELDMNESI